MPGGEPSRFVRREPRDPAGHLGAFPSESAFVLSRDAAREVDRVAVEQFGVPSIVLMENAAIALAQQTIALMLEAGVRDATVVCGPGNNGGDGLAVARHLHNAGADVRVVLTPGSRGGDAGINLEIVERMGLEIVRTDDGVLAEGPTPGVVVDALFGTGLTRDVEGAAAALVGWINDQRARGSRVIAADVPTGIDADSGAVLGCAVRADRTVTFAGAKPGLVTLDAQEYVGELVIAPIGCPRGVIEALGTPIDPPPGGES
ncbi:MAG: NAD(P)H-hydrate epimerase [Phycisphaerales bacterium]